MKFSSVCILALSAVSQAFAEPVPRAATHETRITSQSPLVSIAGTLSTAANTIVGDVDNLGATIGKDVIGDIVPAVASTLQGVETSLQAVVDSIGSSVASIVVPLAENEYEGLVTVLKTLNTVVSGLETSIGNVVKAVPGELKPFIVNEITTVLNLVSPLVQPIVDLALSVAGSVGTEAEIATDLKGLVASVETIVDALLDPVGEVLKDLMQ